MCVCICGWEGELGWVCVVCVNVGVGVGGELL